MYLNIKTNKLRIPRFFVQPREEKLQECRDFYEKNGYFDKDIVINSKLIVADGYARVLVAKENNIDRVDVYMYDVSALVFGVFDDNDKERCWGVTRNTENKDLLRIGGRAKVESKDEIMEITITKIVDTFDNSIKVGALKSVVSGLA